MFHPQSYPLAQGMSEFLHVQSSPTDAMSVYSNPRSNSSDVSAPITPLSLSDSGGYEGAHDLAYPDYAGFDAPFGGHADPAGGGGTGMGGVGAAEHSYGVDDMQAYAGGMEDAFRSKSSADSLSGALWDSSMEDETPRAGKVDRKLSHVGQLLANTQLDGHSAS
ncbi:hypothetical protein BV20DRAFT_1056935 [Pilatotrama ljubarskyi]|nr:hypothetical protein BV20DRAFT_1056935 [Pilatotrama ljubarskyi]